MTIFCITLRHEYQGGNGSYYDWYIDPDQGYYPTAEARDLRLSELRAKEREAWDERQRREHLNWQERQEARDHAIRQQDVLEAAGGDPRLIPVPWTGNEPQAKEWSEGWSEYDTEELEMGAQ